MKNKRQSEILKLLFSEQSLKTEYLSSYFGVSIETIRRDINELSRSGMIKKVYGGIRLNNDSMQMAALENWNERLTNFHEEKIKIATKALEFISDNSVIAWISERQLTNCRGFFPRKRICPLLQILCTLPANFPKIRRIRCTASAVW